MASPFPLAKVPGEVARIIPIDPAFPNRIPTATTDAQVRALIAKAVADERARCVRIMQDEISRLGVRYPGWSWDKVREKIVAIIMAG